MIDDALAVVRTDDWKQGLFLDRDGTLYRVEGECETDRCGAVCCRVSDWRGKVGQSCEHLRGDLRCAPHADHGAATKPISCLIWPIRPADVDKVNELARRQGYAQRCHLQVNPVNHGDSR